MLRTSRTQITFHQPFALTGVGPVQPAGVYDVETDEELISNLSFAVYRKVCIRITLAPDPARPGCSETAVIDASELAAVIVNDALITFAEHERTDA